MNQFAKISPIVDVNGFIMKLDNNGQYTITSDRQLKENEIGICKDDHSLIAMINNGTENVPIKLIGGSFETIDDALEYLTLNYGKLDSQILTFKDRPLEIFIGKGDEVYNPIENSSKSITIEFECGKEYPFSIYSYNLGKRITNSNFNIPNLYNQCKNIINSIHIEGPKTTSSNDPEYKGLILNILPEGPGHINNIYLPKDSNMNYTFNYCEMLSGPINLCIAAYNENGSESSYPSTIVAQSGYNKPKVIITINYTPVIDGGES